MDKKTRRAIKKQRLAILAKLADEKILRKCKAGCNCEICKKSREVNALMEISAGFKEADFIVSVSKKGMKKKMFFNFTDASKFIGFNASYLQNYVNREGRDGFTELSFSKKGFNVKILNNSNGYQKK